MKLRDLLTLAWALAILAATAGCNRELVLKTPLEPEEKISKDDTVLVDGKAVGRVKSVVTENGQRIAVFALSEESIAKERMRAGVLRVRGANTISLRTDAVDPQSPLLVSGGVIPVISKTGFVIRQFTSNRVLTVAFVALAVLTIILLLFRRLAGSWLLLLTLVLSAWGAWALLPWASDAVVKVYSLLPHAQQGSEVRQGLSRLIHDPPDPQMVGYAAVFLVTFILLSVVMRSSLKRLTRQV